LDGSNRSACPAARFRVEELVQIHPEVVLEAEDSGGYEKSGHRGAFRHAKEPLRLKLNLINIVINLRELSGLKRLASLNEVDWRLALPD
jgi:hypothetical protein